MKSNIDGTDESKRTSFIIRNIMEIQQANQKELMSHPFRQRRLFTFVLYKEDSL